MFLVDGGFGQWSSFTECSRTCGSGVKTRIRYCNSPEPRGISAKNCTGNFKEIRHCKLALCFGRLCAQIYVTAEAIAWRCSTEKVFIKISQILQENTCAVVFFKIKIQASDQQLY